MLTREDFNALLADRGILVIDGALATELEARGHNLNHPLWSAKTLRDDPESIKQVHLDYYLAGAGIAITASYQASIEGLHDHFRMSEDESSRLIRHSVELAHQARKEAYSQGVSQDRKLLVAGSVGPYGAFLADGSEYSGLYKRLRTQFQDFHRPRIQALIEADVDILAIETVPNLEEIKALLALLRDEFPISIAWLSCTLRNTRHISDGTNIEEVCRVVNDHQDQVVALGVNCVPTHLVSETLQNMEAYTQVPLLCYPNSGESWDGTTKTWSGAGSDSNDLGQQVLTWRDARARLIGGCCRTGPKYIKTLTKILQEHS